MFFFPLSEYTRTFIIKCSSSVLQRTRHESQETMENVNKAERIVEYLFKKFSLNLSFCSFIFFFWYRSQVFLGRKIKLRRKGGGEGREKATSSQIKPCHEGATREKRARGPPTQGGGRQGGEEQLQGANPRGRHGQDTALPYPQHIGGG